MAKARDPDLAPAIRALISAQGMLEVHVTPNARHCALSLPPPGDPPVLTIRTTATPQDGKANQEVIRLVAAALGIAKGGVVLARGATARRKLLKVLQ